MICFPFFRTNPASSIAIGYKEEVIELCRIDVEVLGLFVLLGRPGNKVADGLVVNNKRASKGVKMAGTVHDVVCGMDIDPATAAGKSEYKGQTYYFCSPGCKRAFDKDPEKYVGAGAQQTHEH